MKSSPKAKRSNSKHLIKKLIINDEKEERFISIKSKNSSDIDIKKEPNEKVNISKEKFLEFNTNLKNDTDKDEKDKIFSPVLPPNTENKKENHYLNLGKKRKKSNFIYPKSKHWNKQKGKKKPKTPCYKTNQKSQEKNKITENFIQIINVFPYNEDNSNNININSTKSANLNDRKLNKSVMDLKLNDSWLNWINGVLSKINENNEIKENEEKVKKEKNPPYTFKKKDVSNFTFSSPNNGCNLKKEIVRKARENFIDIDIKKEDVYDDLLINKCHSSNNIKGYYNCQ